MGWKDWSYTKRGALIGIVIDLVIIIIFNTWLTHHAFSTLMCITQFWIPCFVMIKFGIESMILIYALGICFWVMIGALIGWIIGKVRKK